MFLFLLSYAGGALTILSPCILPVLPFVFARSDKPFAVSGLPLLAGMALTFALVATLAAVGGAWVVTANEYGRFAALIVLAFLGLTLLIPSLAERLTRPLVALGARLSTPSGNQQSKRSVLGQNFLLGIATGFLWAPCAGPILGLLLTGAALQGASIATSLLLLAYALGAATSLAAALLLGGKIFAAMKRALGAGEWVRKGLGVAVLAGVAAIATGLDRGLLTQVSLASTSRLEQAVIDTLHPEAASPPQSAALPENGILPVEGRFPSLDGAQEWLNSPPLSAGNLKGKVVLIDFWTYSCINCVRTIPYVRAWAEKYKNQGLVVIGVHTPEFAFERNVANVVREAKALKVTYPIAIDNAFSIWQAFDNRYWPAHYFIDAKGQIRHHHFGEGNCEQSERVIQTLLKEAGQTGVPGGYADTDATGAEIAADMSNVQSPETYLGYERMDNFASGAPVKDSPHAYAVPATLALNHWGLEGNWTVQSERSMLATGTGKIAFQFAARDLHLVLGAPSGKKVRFRITIDGKPPGADHGVDTNAAGEGVIDGQRLYQLVRQQAAGKERRFGIEFLDDGAEAFAFTFG